jgi:hypothetical protein
MSVKLTATWSHMELKQYIFFVLGQLQLNLPPCEMAIFEIELDQYFVALLLIEFANKIV